MSETPVKEPINPNQPPKREYGADVSPVDSANMSKSARHLSAYSISVYVSDCATIKTLIDALDLQDSSQKVGEWKPIHIEHAIIGHFNTDSHPGIKFSASSRCPVSFEICQTMTTIKAI